MYFSSCSETGKDFFRSLDVGKLYTQLALKITAKVLIVPSLVSVPEVELAQKEVNSLLALGFFDNLTNVANNVVGNFDLNQTINWVKDTFVGKVGGFNLALSNLGGGEGGEDTISNISLVLGANFSSTLFQLVGSGLVQNLIGKISSSNLSSAFVDIIGDGESISSLGNYLTEKLGLNIAQLDFRDLKSSLNLDFFNVGSLEGINKLEDFLDLEVFMDGQFFNILQNLSPVWEEGRNIACEFLPIFCETRSEGEVEKTGQGPGPGPGGKEGNSICGGGVIEGNEECEDGDLGGKNCTDFMSFTGGTLGCENCTFDKSQCERETETCNNN